MKVEEADFNALYHFFSSSATLETEVFNKMCSFLKKKQFLKGEPILRAGEIETKSSLVIKGIVHQYIFDNNVAITTNLTPQGLPFNSLKSYIEASPSIEIHEAITDVEIIYMEKKTWNY